MRIKEALDRGQTVSFEVFPPKPEMDGDLSGIARTLDELRAAKPDFVSVTYGAGGENRPRALDIAKMVLERGMVPLSHLTAVGYSREETERVLKALAALGVKNILALRGDIPVGQEESDSHWRGYKKACDLAAHVREVDEFCIGAAAYPEGHQQSVCLNTDIEYMREKVAAGVCFFITQLFFDDDTFLRFRDSARKAGIETPILVGIMPVFRARQIKRIVEISGCKVPKQLQLLLDKYIDDDDSMTQSGTDFAARQIMNLWREGVDGVHIYTMNKSKGVLGILERCDIKRQVRP